MAPDEVKAFRNALGSPVALASFHVRDWDAWAPGRQTAEDWYLWATGVACPGSKIPVVAEAVPSLLRRRVGSLGQQALRAAWNLPGSRTGRLIFASRHGEFSRTLSILDSLSRDEPPSPADFTLSVHHALAGLLSIARTNRRGHTAIAAGRDSFACGMLEALACLTERPEDPVVLVYYDEPLPPPFADFDDDGDHLALAFTLAAAGEGPPLTLSLSPPPAGGTASATPAQDFLRFFLNDGGRADCLGERQVWHWKRG